MIVLIKNTAEFSDTFSFQEMRGLADFVGTFVLEHSLVKMPNFRSIIELFPTA